MNDIQQTGLQLAVALLAQIGDERSDAAIVAVHDLADEHAQRVTMQHHAADLAQRVVDLEAERVKDAEAIATYRGQMRSLQGYAERLEGELDALHSKREVPDGWRLVPVEPADEMCIAGGEAVHDAGIGSDDESEADQNAAASIYSAMVAAAPEYKA